MLTKKKKTTCWRVYTVKCRPGNCVSATGKLEFIQQSLNQWRVLRGGERWVEHNVNFNFFTKIRFIV